MQEAEHESHRSGYFNNPLDQGFYPVASARPDTFQSGSFTHKTNQPHNAPSLSRQCAQDGSMGWSSWSSEIHSTTSTTAAVPTTSTTAAPTGKQPGVVYEEDSDIPVSAEGRGATLFRGVMDNTDVFFKAMQAVLGGVR